MPYYLHSLEIEPTDTDRIVATGIPFPNMRDARSEMQAGQTVTFVISPTEHRHWNYREQDRFADGIYLPVPWANVDRFPNHFVHLSIRHPGLLAYTETEEKGYLDRQTQIRPGRYLEQFYAGLWDRQTIAAYVAECTVDALTVHYATDPDLIEQIYLGGPSSCMSHEPSYYLGPMHPTRAYGNSDLAVAYIGPPDNVRSRCVVWPAKRIYTRIYGDPGTMQPLLERDGYRHGYLAGARIPALSAGSDRFVCPYIDGCGSAEVSRDRKWLELTDSGSYTTQSLDPHMRATGLAHGFNDEPWESDDSNLRECDHCGCEYDPDDDSDATSEYCGSCECARWQCDHCDQSYFDDPAVHENGIRLCADCESELTVQCTNPDCENEWIEMALPWRDRRRRRRSHTADYCVDCESDLFWYCDVCGTSARIGANCECQPRMGFDDAANGME